MKRLKLMLLCTVVLCVGGCQREIIHDLADREARRVITVLDELSIPAERARGADGKWVVSVPAASEGRALRVLKERRILKERDTAEVLAPSIFSGPLDEQLRFERTLSGNVVETLLSLDGVLDASVHLNIPVPTGALNAGSRPASGSVLVVAGPDLLMTEEEIARLVAGAAGVSSESITVIIKSGRISEYGVSSEEISTQETSSSWLSAIDWHHSVGIVIAVLGGLLMVTGVMWRVAKS